jgi:hypothetical protein
MRLRPATAADAAVATELIIAVDVDQVGEADYSLETLHDEWNEVGFVLAQDAVVVEDAAGTAIAYAHFQRPDRRRRPAARGGGRGLRAAGVGRAARV